LPSRTPYWYCPSARFRRKPAEHRYAGKGVAQHGEVFGRLRAAALAADGSIERLCYLEWSADPGCDLDDREQWAKANPALGRRITLEAIEAERQEFSDEGFSRERWGRGRLTVSSTSSRWSGGRRWRSPVPPAVARRQRWGWTRHRIACCLWPVRGYLMTDGNTSNCSATNTFPIL
jgi:hypothetical protein